MTFAISLAWLAATATVILAAAVLAGRIGSRNSNFRVADIIVISWSWAIMAAAGLSVTRRLSGPSLMISLTVVAIGSLVFCSLFPHCGRAGPLPKPRGLRARRSLTQVWLSMAWVLVIGAWIGHIIARGLLQFPVDFDSLMYHIPLIDYWLQAGSLYAPASAHWSNPGTNEVLGLWSVAPFDCDFLISLNNIPAALLFANSLLELGKILGISQVMRHLTSLAALSNYVVVTQSTGAENDLAVAGLFLASLCYGLRYAKHGRPADLGLFAASLGLLTGVKYYALGYSGLSFCTIVLVVWWHRGSRVGVRVIVVGTIGVALLGGYWYVRNVLASGSPLYPLVLASVPNSTSFKMDYPQPWRTTFLGNGRPEIWGLALEAVWKMTGPWHTLAVLAVPATLAWAVTTGVRASGRRLYGAVRVALALLMLGSCVVLSITPMALEDVPGTLNHLRWAYTPARYGLSFLTVVTLGLALMLDDIRSRIAARGHHSLAVAVARSSQILIGGSAVYQVAFLDGSKVNWAAVGFAGLDALVLYWGYLHLCTAQPRNRLPIIAGLILLGSLGMAAGMAQLAVAWDAQFVEFYDDMYSTHVFREIATVAPPPMQISPFEPRCYPFFGPHRQYRLCQEKPSSSYENVSAFLGRWDVTHVVVPSSGPTGPEDRENFHAVAPWLAAHSSEFRLIRTDAKFSFYQISRPQRDREPR